MFLLDRTSLLHSVKVKSLTVSRTLTCAKESCKLHGGAHGPRPACPMGVLVRGANDGVDGAATELQPLTVKQELHHSSQKFINLAK